VLGFWKSSAPRFVNGLQNGDCDKDFLLNKPTRPTCIVMLPCEPKEACLGNNTVCVPPEYTLA
jgi:hypothetical protein